MFCDTAINLWGLIYLQIKVWIQYSQKPAMAIDSGTYRYSRVLSQITYLANPLLAPLTQRQKSSRTSRERAQDKVQSTGDAHKIKSWIMNCAA